MHPFGSHRLEIRPTPYVDINHTWVGRVPAQLQSWQSVWEIPGIVIHTPSLFYSALILTKPRGIRGGNTRNPTSPSYRYIAASGLQPSSYSWAASTLGRGLGSDGPGEQSRQETLTQSNIQRSNKRGKGRGRCNLDSVSVHIHQRGSLGSRPAAWWMLFTLLRWSAYLLSPRLGAKSRLRTLLGLCSNRCKRSHMQYKERVEDLEEQTPTLHFYIAVSFCHSPNPYWVCQ